MQTGWIERLFSRLSSLYGAQFGRQWDGANVADVKAVWAEKLGGFNASQIGAALKGCDDRTFPPNLPEFIDLCRNAARRDTVPPALTAPQLSADELRERAKTLEAAAHRPAAYDYRGWCKELRSRYLAGECLLPMQIALAAEAMGEVWEKYECRAAA